MAKSPAGPCRPEPFSHARTTGNDSGDEPTTIGSGADGKSCIYKDSDITTL